MSETSLKRLLAEVEGEKVTKVRVSKKTKELKSPPPPEALVIKTDVAHFRELVQLHTSGTLQALHPTTAASPPIIKPKASTRLQNLAPPPIRPQAVSRGFQAVPPRHQNGAESSPHQNRGLPPHYPPHFMFSPHFLPPQLLPSDLAYGFHPETPGSVAMNDMARYQAVQHVMLHSQYAMAYCPGGPGAFALPGLGMGMQVTSLPIFAAGSQPAPPLPLQGATEEEDVDNMEGEEGQPP